MIPPYRQEPDEFPETLNRRSTMTKTATPNAALETSFVTEEQTATLVSNVELALSQLDEISGGDCSCTNCCSHSLKTVNLRANIAHAISLPTATLPTQAIRGRI
jgi:hypothetical protein